MAYKVGSTVVIDDSGLIDWARISNKPSIGAGTITAVSVANTAPSSGPVVNNAGSNCATNCYVDSLSGGGTTGAVTVTAVRRTFNCACQCRC
ncbi:MAG: hypothetical protein ACNA7M_05060 [Roseovarius sp.]